MKNTSGILRYIAFLLTVLLYACQEDTIEGEKIPTTAGAIIDVQLVESYNKQQITEEYKRLLPSFIASVLVPTYEVEIYKVVYSTKDVAGKWVKASGAVVIPKGVNKAMPLASYQHGTILARAEAPSRGLAFSFEVLIGMLLGSDGMLVAMPDYLGLGDSEGLHPYLHAASEASASLDMMRAAINFAATKNIGLNKQTFLIGYSQGGHATMALQKEIEARYSNEFSITASAPMAGPYDITGTIVPSLSSSDSFEAPVFIPYFLLAYDKVYDWYKEQSEVFVAPYDKEIPPLFNGNKSYVQIDPELPRVPSQMLQPEFIKSFTSDQNHPLRKAVVQNDVYNWKPSSPMRLYHCQGDQTVPYENSQTALKYFQTQNRTDIPLITPDGVPGLSFGHTDCAILTVLLARTWFLELMK